MGNTRSFIKLALAFASVADGGTADTTCCWADRCCASVNKQGFYKAGLISALTISSNSEKSKEKFNIF